MAAPKAMATRMGLYVAFLYAKQPLRIKQVLHSGHAPLALCLGRLCWCALMAGVPWWQRCLWLR